MRIPAIVAAGDRRAAKDVYGESKVYLEIHGRPLVAHVVATLQRVPEVSEVWVVGNAERLRAVFEREEIRAELRKPLHVVPQFRNLYENAWQTYRRLLPGAGPEGRDPGPEDLDQAVLYVSGDVPFATPQEISELVRRAEELGCGYGLGLVTEASLEPFYPQAPGEPGIHMAYYNLREGRFRQGNVHVVRPARLGNRYYIEEMYEHRYQKQFGNVVALVWRLLRSEHGGPSMALYFLLIQLAGVLDRRGWRRLADRVRRLVSLRYVEKACSSLLRTDFRIIVTDVGGCALDIDNERDYDAAKARFDEWSKAQAELAERLYGPLLLPATSEADRSEP